jgi:hypothetical protein
LSIGEWISRKLFRAGLIGQIVVGLIYGVPLGNILDNHWQDTFIALGYFGLILIVFEGRLTSVVSVYGELIFTIQVVSWHA